MRRATRILINATMATVLVLGTAPAASAAPTSVASYNAAVQGLAQRLGETAEREEALTVFGEDGLPAGRVQSIEEATASSAQSRAALPESYTAPYTSVKDQVGTQSCWAFAAVASIESAYLKQQGIETFGGDEIDLSEAQTVYATNNGQTIDGTVDGKELTTSDNDHPSTTEYDDYGYSRGGFSYRAVATWAAGRGVALEEYAPFKASVRFTNEEARSMAEAAAAAYTQSDVQIGEALYASGTSPILSQNENGMIDRVCCPTTSPKSRSCCTIPAH